MTLGKGWPCSAPSQGQAPPQEGFQALGSRDSGCGGGPGSAELSHSTASTYTSLENVQEQGGGHGQEGQAFTPGIRVFIHTAPWSEAAGLWVCLCPEG